MSREADFYAIGRRFLECVYAAKTLAECAALGLDTVLSVILGKRGPRAELRVVHGNGRVSIYTRRPTPLKSAVRKRQANKWAAAVRRLDGTGAARTDGARALSARTLPTVSQQVGLLAAIGFSDAKWNRMRTLYGGRASGMARRHCLSCTREVMRRSPAMTVTVDDTGAHMARLRDAVEKRLGDLWDAGQFVERCVSDEHHVAISQTGDYEVSTEGGPLYPDGCPPSDMRDVHLSFGLDKGGSPSSVKVVLGLLNQDFPARLGNTILLSVCPCDRDGYDEVAGMLRFPLLGLHGLLLHGVMVGGHRCAVQLFLAGDYMAMCTVQGHKGPSATLPCLVCLATKPPSQAQHTLDMAFGTMQDLTSNHSLRRSHHLREMSAEYGSTGGDARDLGVAVHLSIERSPLLVTHPRQLAPLPLHTTCGRTRRLVVVAIEAVTMERGQADEHLFADLLASKLCLDSGVQPVPYNGGNFIGRHCLQIARGSDLLCQALLGLVSDERHGAYKRA